VLASLVGCLDIKGTTHAVEEHNMRGKQKGVQWRQNKGEGGGWRWLEGCRRLREWDGYLREGVRVGLDGPDIWV
jgi:hypothetical protein